MCAGYNSCGGCYACKSGVGSVNTKCSVSGYYNGTPCSGFAEYAFGECGLKYQEMGATCSSQGLVGQGSCDGDGWRSCCEQCTGAT